MKRKMLLFGLDGGTLNVLRPLADRGIIPFFAKLMKNGLTAPLRSTIPFVSPTAWASFITGKNPGKHGVFDFRSKVPASYDFEKNIPNIPKKGTIWKYLSDNNLRSLIFNIPMTYPPQPINGSLISGFGTPGINSNFTYPSALKKEILDRFDYVLDVYWAAKRVGQESKLLNEITHMTRTQFDVLNHLMQRDSYDFVALGIISTDRIQHRFFDSIQAYIDDESYSDDIIEEILQHMSMVDIRLQQLYEGGSFTDLILMSDHGFRRIDKGINLNRFFQNKGWLYFQKNTPHRMPNNYNFLRRIGITGHNLRKLARKLSLNNSPLLNKALHSKEILQWDSTKVFSLTAASIYLNVKGREPTGVVHQKDYDSFRDEVMHSLLSFEHQGRPVINRVYKREDIYHGPNLDIAPDLIIGDPASRFLIDTTIDQSRDDVVAPKELMTGDHSIDGVFIAQGNSFTQGPFIQKPQIVDLLPTILAYYDIPVPNDIDGRVLEEIFADKPIMTTIQPHDPDDTDDYAYTDDEKNDIIENLKGLGYL